MDPSLLASDGMLWWAYVSSQHHLSSGWETKEKRKGLGFHCKASRLTPPPQGPGNTKPSRKPLFATCTFGLWGRKCLFNLTFLGHISSLGEVRAELQAGTQGQELKQRGRERLFTGLLCSSLFSWLCFQLSTEMLVSYGNKKIRSGISSINTWLRTHTSNFER